jgi:hypothetical protein
MGGWGKFSRVGALALVAAIAAIAAVPALALRENVTALTALERGRWLVHSAAQRPLARSICLGDPALLFQLEHGPTGCVQELVAADGRGGIVQYSCQGRGYGRTSVRVETSKVVTIDTQGLIDGRPFAYRATARKVSDC